MRCVALLDITKECQTTNDNAVKWSALKSHTNVTGGCAARGEGTAYRLATFNSCSLRLWVHKHSMHERQV